MALNDRPHGIGHAAAMARKPHKKLCLSFYTELTNFIGDDEDEFEIIGEWCIDQNNLESDAPDLVVFRQGETIACLIVEITTSKEFKTMITKVKRLAEEYSVEEYFVYDYEKYVWYSNHDNDTSYSEILELNLSDFV